MASRNIYYAIILIVLVGVVSSVGTYYLTLPPAQKKLDKVIIATGWVIIGSDAPLFAALENGFYEENGISATILRGYGSADTARRVATGRADFGQVDLSALIPVRGEGLPIKAISVAYAENPLVVYSLKSKGITEPKDLEGLIVGGAPGAAHTLLFPTFLQIHDVDINTIEYVHISTALHLQSLLSDQVDAMSSMVTAYPDWQLTAKEEGLEITYMPFGFDMYGQMLTASDDTINNNPDLVRRFMEATYKGYEWAMDNRAEAVDIILKYNPELDSVKTRGRLDLLFDVLMEPQIGAGKSGTELGIMDPTIMEESYNLIDQYYEISEPYPVEDLYTNEFLSS
jgi:NitT/TauT family transport system substrate-binding protein